jgi:hypothetical protein
VLDGPFTETKEQLLGLYLFQADSMEEAVDAAKMLPQGIASMEVPGVGRMAGITDPQGGNVTFITYAQ